MTDTKLDYLRRVLSLNPEFDAEEILDVRRCFLQGEQIPICPNPEVFETNPRATRSEAKGTIDGLRTKFWSIDHAEAIERLEALDLTPFPELQKIAHQLRLVSLERGVFADLERSFSGTPGARKFIELYRCLLVTSGQDFVRLRRFFLTLARGGQPPGWSDDHMKDARQAVDQLLLRLPESAVFELEILRSIQRSGTR